MRWFHDITARSKFTLSFTVMILLLAAVVLTSYYGIRQIEASQRRIYEMDFATALELKDIRTNQFATRAHTIEMASSDDRLLRDRSLQEIRKQTENNDELFTRLEKRLQNEPVFFPRLKELMSLRKEFVQTRFEQEIPLIMAGEAEKAKLLLFGVQQERNRQMGAVTDDLITQIQKRAEGEISAASKSVDRLGRIFTTISAMALVAAIFLTTLLNRAISDPLKELTARAQAIASGDFSTPEIPRERHDEVGQLTLAFQQMNGYLGRVAEMAEQVASGNLSAVLGVQSQRDSLGRALTTMSDALRTMTAEIQDAVNIIANSAGQILSSTTQVAASVTETASAVVETTTTTEEVRQTSEVSTEKANRVAEAAQRAVQISESGSSTVEEVAERMKGIRQQMESIAGRIIMLSEQSQAIGEIIATVNDLAEQSNLLAVNAAIEAAKAGEHGKGFSVVAQEVKNLAEQSKQATAQVRTILNDIQKATSAAVLATEQGSKTVDEGVHQSIRAGESIRSLSASIVEAAEAASQIAASSQQQLIGMEQVLTAMENIKQASEQNVMGTRQVEAAARNIHQLGGKLKELVSRYRI
ncbi:methyl-accepting chemotaxis protein [Geobacter sp. DSM 9736]|uniref:methyl-accepting chemotaxis protein n=1 Tax=Geobacter sp. DSM 9736 TaxID=1277350 RepID=UPI000B5024E3|nr:methyl-accepting chemotaxis protein [Geobacter sp. DSM 9736]SNB44745.1 Methyl-accepting chemotaxis protein [Geobacter sp. DSM 9736]